MKAFVSALALACVFTLGTTAIHACGGMTTVNPPPLTLDDPVDPPDYTDDDGFGDDFYDYDDGDCVL